MKTILILFACIMSLNLNAQSNAVQTPAVSRSTTEESKKDTCYTWTIISAANNTWCYDIYKEKHLLIHQTSIPGLPGNEGFKTKTDAEKVAKLVIEKIKKGEMPPTVTIEEMKKLNVL
jgi:hypothetical protein